MKRIYDAFVNPGPEYRGKPFWAWNGKLEKEELLRQVHVIKEMGFGGFFMHSRTGLVTEYLGDDWFELINTCADEAEKLGLEAWLYDEDRWPSGTAGGMVTCEPKFRLKFICLEIVEAKDFQWKEEIIAAFLCKLEGISYYDCRRIQPEMPVDTQAGTSILVFTIVEAGKSSFYNGYTYLDTLNREATDRFIELTHEEYKKRCGEKFGKSLKGIFTDEPHRGALMDGFCVGNPNGDHHAPWTYTLFDRFKEKYGYDLVSSLPELFLRPEGAVVSQVKWHYVELLQEMFLENFAIPVHEWCKESGLILTGHMLHEDNLTAQTAMCGSAMRFYEHMGYPGVDVLTEGNRNFWIVKQLSSAARQLGKKQLLSELYGCTGWQMSFEGHKAVGDWQALLGINLRCHHLSWYTMEGEAKRDFPASILHQSTWWKEYKYVEDYFARIGLVMSQGKPCCDVLVINPVESVWCQVHAGWSGWLSAKSREVQDLEEKYAKLFHWLMGAQIDFDYGDEEMLGRLYKVECGREGHPVLKVGEASYKVAVVAGMTTIRSSTLKVLEEFIQAGGRVIFAGEVPDHVDALQSSGAARVAAKASQVALEKEAVVEACRAAAEARVFTVDGKTGRETEEIFSQMRENGRENGSEQILLMLNINREKAYEDVRIRVKAEGCLEEWNCATGERIAITAEKHDGFLEFIADFPPAGERLFIIHENRGGMNFVHEDIASGADENTMCEKLSADFEKELQVFNGPFEYKLDEPNVCVLDRAAWRIGNNPWQSEIEILKVDREIRRQLGMNLRGGEMLQPWFTGKKESEIRGRITLNFQFYVRDIPSGLVELVMEKPEDFVVRLNGRPVDTTSFAGCWVDRCFHRIPLSAECLTEGRNVLELEADFHDGINLEALYMLGQFGVTLEGTRKILTVLPDRIAAGDLVPQGLPFYSGKVTYRLDTHIKPQNGERVWVRLNGFDGACVKATSPGRFPRIIAWQPYETDVTEYLQAASDVGLESGLIHEPKSGPALELELVLTRRNTFGPLHQVPLYTFVYGPDNFITEGENFSEEYMLVPSGIRDGIRLIGKWKTAAVCPENWNPGRL